MRDGQGKGRDRALSESGVYPNREEGKKRLQTLHTYPHASQLRVRSRSLLSLSDREEEQREKVEDISQKSIQTIVIDDIVLPHIVQLLD